MALRTVKLEIIVGKLRGQTLIAYADRVKRIDWDGKCRCQLLWRVPPVEAKRICKLLGQVYFPHRRGTNNGWMTCKHKVRLRKQ